MQNFQKGLKGRYVTLQNIDPIIKDLGDTFCISEIGKSFLGKSIKKIEFGKGSQKILIWSQMHGNESTGTKAMFDLLKFMENPGTLVHLRNSILEHCQISFIPILNPDGAEQYTRVSAQNIDLNRDAVEQTAPESQILYHELKIFNPNFCFNLHDQRTIFSVGRENKPATLSFLAPSTEVNREITEGRKVTMSVISGIKSLLDDFIPDQLGRYTDEFYPTATGDNFQKAGYPTVLIESGHYQNDYSREVSRKYTFYSMLQGLNSIVNGLEYCDYKDYFLIPENKQNLYDIILRSCKLNDEKTDIAIQLVEVLNGDSITFEPKIANRGNLKAYSSNIILDTDRTSNLIFNSEENLLQYIVDNLSIQ
ncbi:M14 family zinc carboxypeptidase [Namhaeicola litoreus]|uniref:M14 family zinc carboxypeptidase n=1 Tax=Namhaeicola litoreus TaxID=1052145 RepID=A0ABW3Y542_9FLAO